MAGAALVGVLCIAFPGRGQTGARPYVPDGNAVVARLPSSSGDPSLRELDVLKASLKERPDDVRVAVEAARAALGIARARSDPRFAGQAEAILAPWWNESAPPEVRLLRATIRQSRHEFDRALDDLDSVIAKDPANAEAWLSRAVVLLVRGRVEDARVACRALSRLASPVIAATCHANVDAASGNAERAYAALESALARAGEQPPGVAIFSNATLATAAARAGRTAEAETWLQAVLELDPGDVPALGDLADLYLDSGRAHEAMRLVERHEDVDPLLLRLALASKVTGHVKAADHASALARRYADNRLRGDGSHLREEARFELGIAGNAKTALALAQRNFEQQREAWDVRILLEAALVARDFSAAGAALTFLRESGMRDRVLTALVERLEREAGT
jgi:Tfp pilus assembly protein PilF